MKDFKGDFARFKRHRAKTITSLDLIIRDLRIENKALKAENKESSERLKICAKNVGLYQKAKEAVTLDIDVKIALFEKDLNARKYHKNIVMMLKQIRSLV